MLDVLYIAITILFFVDRGLRGCLRKARPMTLDYIIGLLVTAGLLVYLTYALLRPEKF